LSVDRLITQLEITTSTLASSRGMSSIVPLTKLALVMPASARLRSASSSISSVMSSPYAVPPGATRRADSRTSRPPPEPRSRTSWPGRSSVNAVGLPQPREAASAPANGVSASSYSPVLTGSFDSSPQPHESPQQLVLAIWSDCRAAPA
jgi:hypothetical protein